MPKKQMHLWKFYNCLVKDLKPVYYCLFIVLFFFSCQCKAEKQGRNHGYLNILCILQDLLMGHLPHMGP